MKLGFRSAAGKIRGFRNTFDITPTNQGRAIGPETGCGLVLIEKYGEFERFQTGDGFDGRHPVELQSYTEKDPIGGYILVDATNSDIEENWNGKVYLKTGKRTYCVSYKHLSTWRCQDGEMDSTGKLVGFGINARGYDLPK